MVVVGIITIGIVIGNVYVNLCEIEEKEKEKGVCFGVNFVFFL